MAPHPQPPSLILHADDFGFNAAVTSGILEAFRSGLLTGTSLLTNAPAADIAVEQWRRLESARQAGELPSSAARRRLGDAVTPFDLGAHLNLTQGVPLTAGAFPGKLLNAAGRFLGPGALYRRLCSQGGRWRGGIRAELQAQVEWLLHRGLTPTHLNGHQYVEMMPVVSGIIADLAREYRLLYVRAATEPGHWRTSLSPGLRLTNCCLSGVKQYYARRWAAALDRAGLAHADAFFGASHAGLIDLAMVRRFIVRAGKHGLTEMALHPGGLSREPDQREIEAGWHDPLAAARPGELALLRSAELAELLAENEFQLGRFSNCQPRTKNRGEPRLPRQAPRMRVFHPKSMPA